MNGKDLFTAWAPAAQERWTKFAKPALFVHVDEFMFLPGSIHLPVIPVEVLQHCGGSTAVIVDLPGANSVEGGLALAKHGFRPVPLYNGIHERHIGGLSQAVDNAPIVDALRAGGDILKGMEIDIAAPPAFMLDSNRNNQVADSFGIYDNRWSIELDDVPVASYMVDAGIKQVVVWSIGAMNNDLLPIVDSYSDIGLEVIHFCGEKTTRHTAPAKPVVNSTILAARAADLKENVRKFENARFALMLVAGMAFVNLLFMFFGRSAPILWTAPSIKWMTYLWVPEIVGDVIAIAMFAAYAVLYFMSQRRRSLMNAALIFLGIDTLVLGIYALWYGLWDYIGGSMMYALIVFGFPVLCLIFIVRGTVAHTNMLNLSDADYYMSLDSLDGGVSSGGSHVGMGRRRHFRGFRGYGGYGGSGRGGYSGGGYRGGYGGGFGGGFGG